MKIYDPYPDRVKVDGKTYKLDLRYDTVLRAFEAQKTDELSALDKQEVLLKTLLKWPFKCPRNAHKQSEVLKAILDLFPKGEGKAQPRYIDFEQDAKLIRSAFLRMGIDLTKERIHFFMFLELLGDVPEDTALSRVIEIRRRPIPEANGKNSKLISQIMEAKAKVAIKYSDEDQRRLFAESLKQSTVLRG